MLKKYWSLCLLISITACKTEAPSDTPSQPNLPEAALFSIQDPLYTQQWYLHQNTDFYQRNNINSNAHIHPSDYLTQYTGKDIKIAIIDDSLDTRHEDLKNAIDKTYTLDGTHDVTPQGEEYHGTSVTGIIAARSNKLGIKGIASNSRIMFLQFTDTITDSEIITLFNEADQWGADIINNSWGTGNASQAVVDVISGLTKTGRHGKGINIVFATGNDNQDITDDESSIVEVISVSATDENNTLAVYSNFGDNLDIVAPGGMGLGISSLDPMNTVGIASTNENYLLFNDASYFVGTSAAAPIVSGVIALLLEKNPNLSAAEISTVLHNSADKIENTVYDYINGRTVYHGYGKINLTQALEAI